MSMDSLQTYLDNLQKVMEGLHLSPIDFFLQAGPVGKAVVLLLLGASVWCWVVIIEGIIGAARLTAALKSWRRAGARWPDRGARGGFRRGPARPGAGRRCSPATQSKAGRLMAMSNSSGSGAVGLHRPLADINVTPLVDVMLVLLIVFMITAPMLAQGLKVDLPQAKAAKPVNPKDPIVVSITKTGGIAIGKDDIQLTDLVGGLQGKLAGDLTRVIQVKADKEANHGAIIGVLDELATNGMAHVALVSDPKPRHAAASSASNADAASSASQTAALPAAATNR